jgi:hypothetical protein
VLLNEMPLMLPSETSVVRKLRMLKVRAAWQGVATLVDPWTKTYNLPCDLATRMIVDLEYANKFIPVFSSNSNSVY